MGRWRRRQAGVGLRRASDVAVMQTTDFGDRDDRAALRRLDWATVGGVLVEREMCASLMVVREVADQDAAQVSFTEDEHVIQTLPPDRADEALREGILPWAVRGREDFLDPQALHAAPKRLAVDLVAVVEEIGWCGVVREGVHDLLGGPVGGGMLGHVKMHDPSAMMSEHDENEEDAQADGGKREDRRLRCPACQSSVSRR